MMWKVGNGEGMGFGRWKGWVGFEDFFCGEWEVGFGGGEVWCFLTRILGILGIFVDLRVVVVRRTKPK
ncbi:MAG TPA: hypothetical protein VLL52_24735 [Anaerolineae bacterium]|nr:hypothetical protein [Anaerolineae bacterium]